MSERPRNLRDGFASIHGYRFYWEIAGEPGPRGTVLTLHGGPGSTHDYLLPFADLARAGYRVVFFDQLGCGRSELARDVGEYSIDRDVSDVEELRQTLVLGRVHLVGSSYGGALAIAYALAHPEGLRTLVSASGLASVPLTVQEMARLKRELPAPYPEILARYEATGEYQHPEYLRAVDAFYRRHLCRLPEWPPELTYSIEHSNSPKYLTMNGPNEFTITGTIRDWDVTDRLREIAIPTLVTAGRYDEVTPRVAESIHAGIRGSHLRRFEESSHVAFWEQRAAYLDALGSFLGAHEGDRPD